jgi:hypothetical protein
VAHAVQGDAERMRAEGIEAYVALKRRILSFTGIIVAAGLAVAGTTGGSDAAQAFALGGMMAVAYQLALNRCAADLGLGHMLGMPDPPSPPPPPLPPPRRPA